MNGYIYLVHAESTNRYKIGFTTLEPSSRISRLQTGSPYPLRLIRFFKGSLRDENALHRQFSDNRLGGEWFEFKSLTKVLKHFGDTEPTDWKIKEYGVWDRDTVAIAVGSQVMAHGKRISLKEARAVVVKKGRARDFWYEVAERMELPDAAPELSTEQMDQVIEWYFADARKDRQEN